MTTDARRKAERCFALARSTAFEGERDNAVAQGTRIAEAAGLPLDSFDIPGRVKGKPEPKPRPSRYADDLFTKPEAPRQYTAEGVAEAFARATSSSFRFKEAADASRVAAEVERQRAEAFARAEAQRKATEAAKANREKAELDAAVQLLAAVGVRAYPLGTGGDQWGVMLKEGLAYVRAADVRGLGALVREVGAKAGRTTEFRTLNRCRHCSYAMPSGAACPNCAFWNAS